MGSCLALASSADQSSKLASPADQSSVLATVPATATWANTTAFVPPIAAGLVIKVYDGDTITIAARLPIADSPLYRFSVRLRGIDSAEIRGKSDAERAAALSARDALSALVLGKPVRLLETGCEKYGRLLAHVYVDGVEGSLSDWMLAHKYAVPYDGGQKAIFNPHEQPK